VQVMLRKRLETVTTMDLSEVCNINNNNNNNNSLAW